jgi:FkbM family methyltransferase
MPYHSIDAMVGEPTVNFFLREVLKPGDTVFDLGANAGWIAMVMSRLVGPTGRVIAFEPGPVVSDLATNLNEQRCVNTYIENAGITAETGYANFVVTDDSQSGSIARDERGTRITVKTWALSDYCLTHNIYPSVIKMDIEGSERDAIFGATDLISSTHPLIIFEQSRDDLRAISLLRDFGYSITNLHDYEPCNSTKDFRGIVQNLVAWKPGHKTFLNGMRHDLFMEVPISAENGFLTTGPIDLPAGRYVIFTDLPNQPADLRVSYRIEIDGKTRGASDGTLYWLSTSYRSIPWFSGRHSRPCICIRGMSGEDISPISIPPVCIKQLISLPN